MRWIYFSLVLFLCIAFANANDLPNQSPPQYAGKWYVYSKWWWWRIEPNGAIFEESIPVQSQLEYKIYYQEKKCYYGITYDASIYKWCFSSKNGHEIMTSYDTSCYELTGEDYKHPDPAKLLPIQKKGGCLDETYEKKYITVRTKN